jgi:L-asparaginase II
VTTPLKPEGAVELATLERSGMIESRHLGAAVVVGPGQDVLAAHGDVDALIYPRSTLKFMQAVAVRDSGLILTGAELAISAASHTGTEAHVELARAILNRAGLDDSALRCPAAWPDDRDSRATATQPRAITMNCSGKHAAFLAACVNRGWSTEDYLEPSHPLQQLIRITVERYTGEPIEYVGVDGCGAPVIAVSLRGLATAISRVTSGWEAAGAELSTAILDHPWVLDSPAVARVIGELGLVAKNGAEGVFVAGAPDGTAVALKMMDGSTRASVTVGLSLLAAAGVIDRARADRLASEVTERVLGRGERVGAICSSV